MSRSALVLAGLLTTSLVRAEPPGAVPPAFDPRAMSGIARPDPALAAGSVTVRCLLGSFSEPAVGIEVELEITTEKGPQQRKSTTDAQGRASFEGLQEFFGATAVARAKLGDELVVSQPFGIGDSAGTRLLLVKGAVRAGTPDVHPEPSAVPHASGDLPQPGQPFAFPEKPAGTLLVGLLDLGRREAIEAGEVELEITRPDGTKLRESGRSDARGRVLFDGLVPPKVPPGSKFEITAKRGEEVRRSDPFELLASGTGIVMTFGRSPAEPPKSAAALPPPRMDPSLPSGSIRLELLDATGGPLANQDCSIVERHATGNVRQHACRSDENGIALVVLDSPSSEAVYEASVEFRGAPFRSPDFLLQPQAGIAVSLQVFETTADPSVLRSAVQFELQPRENDKLQVVQLYEAMVAGTLAFWPGPGFRLHGADSAKGLVVLDAAANWLVQPEKAPFASLSEPLPPGQVVQLSLAYLLDHDGEAEIRWTPPFTLLQASVVLPQELELIEPAMPGKSLPADHGMPAMRVYELGQLGMGQTVALRIGGLPKRPAIFRQIAVVGAVLMGLGLLGVMLHLPRARRAAEAQLQARRNELQQSLADPGLDETRRQQIVTALDRVYRQLDRLAGNGSRPS